MKLLQISSLLFISNIIYSYYLQNNIYHHLTLLITIFSILNHGYNIKEKNIIKYIDKIIAHITFFYITINDTPKIFIYNPYIIIYPIICASLFISEYIFYKYYIIIHFCFHITAVYSINIYLYNLQIK
jgi:hypothetical protein